VTACFFGEGAMAEGEFHESMNLAALWRLPVLFCCENNLYAMGTALERSEAALDLPAKARGYGMPATTVDGMIVQDVEGGARDVVETVRHAGPYFLELRTYRFRAHSMYDPELYRDKAEVERWKQRDPITALTDRLRADGALDDVGWQAMTEAIAADIAAAVAAADAAPPEPVEDLTRFVYSEA
jgi:TPP-dependent pyruvate/acetoin dehydrogenase alpha subunit